MGGGHGFDVHTTTLDAVGATLRGASGSLEGMADPPPAPEAGAVTASVAAALALLTDSIAGASESLDTVGGAVNDANRTYQQHDSHASSLFAGVL